MRVIIQQPKRLDEIVFSHYGTLKVLESVIEDNQHLVNKITLDIGDEVVLNEFETNEKESNSKTLWD